MDNNVLVELDNNRKYTYSFNIWASVTALIFFLTYSVNWHVQFVLIYLVSSYSKHADFNASIKLPTETIYTRRLKDKVLNKKKKKGRGINT